MNAKGAKGAKETRFSLRLPFLLGAVDGMESVPGAVATGSKPIAIIEIGGIVTRSLPLPVLTSCSNWDTTAEKECDDRHD